LRLLRILAHLEQKLKSLRKDTTLESTKLRKLVEFEYIDATYYITLDKLWLLRALFLMRRACLSYECLNANNCKVSAISQKINQHTCSSATLY